VNCRHGFARGSDGCKADVHEFRQCFGRQGFSKLRDLKDNLKISAIGDVDGRGAKIRYVEAHVLGNNE
jgi:hypothetical protein